MARLFSISFYFQEKEYTALVSLRDLGHDLCCTIRYIDKELRFIIPGDQLVFSLQEGLKEPKQLPHELAENLLKCTTNALTEHLALRG